MTKIEHTQEPLPEGEYFCVNLKVKQRYINPLTVVECPQSGYIETSGNLDTAKSSAMVSIRPSDYSTTVLARMYKTFRNMTKIEHTQEPLPESEYFCVNLKVKQRYINPLVVVECPRSGYIETTVESKRLSEVSEKARRIIVDFKTFSDTPYGCVKLI